MFKPPKLSMSLYLSTVLCPQGKVSWEINKRDRDFMAEASEGTNEASLRPFGTVVSEQYFVGGESLLGLAKRKQMLGTAELPGT